MKYGLKKWIGLGYREQQQEGDIKWKFGKYKTYHEPLSEELTERR